MTEPTRPGPPAPVGATAVTAADRAADSLAATLAEKLAGGRKLIESVIIAVITSTGVYLVGSIYTEAYFGRMSIDAVALDLPPPYIALQATHAVQSLLVYPVVLVLLYLLDRFTAARLPRARSWLGQLVDRLGWLAYLAINIIVVLPLLLAAEAAGSNRALIQTTSALSEAVSLMQFVALALVAYLIWLSLARRTFLLSELKLHHTLPMALVAAIILLGALINTADRARTNAERLMTGASDTSLTVTFTMADRFTLPSENLIFVAMRNSHYFVVERQPDPPSLTPRSFAVPYRAVDAVEFERVNPAPPSDKGFIISLEGLGTAPGP